MKNPRKSISGNTFTHCLQLSWFELVMIGGFHKNIKSTTAFDQQLELTAACIAEQLCNISRL
jgi:hypothetical protein